MSQYHNGKSNDRGNFKKNNSINRNNSGYTARNEHPRFERKDDGERRYGKPANSFNSDRPRFERKDDGERRYGKPANSFNNDRPRFDRKESGLFDRQNTQSRFNGGEKLYQKSEYRPVRGAIRTYGRPAPRVTPVQRPAPSDGLASRRVALKVIRDVTEKNAFASLSLNEALKEANLNPLDRRLAARLAYDTIEHLFYLDEALGQIMAKADTDLRLRNVLRLGACQLLLEDKIPESAATNTSVMLCREIGLDELAGVCNGILRNLIRKKEELVWPDPETETLRARSVRYSVPEWIIGKLDQDWGEETADALMGCRNNESITIRPNHMKLTDAEFDALLEQKVWRKASSPLPGARRIADMADLSLDNNFKNGLFSIQSESSMMACLAVQPKRGMQLLDACAAPGGKSCYLAEMMQGTGRVYSWEKHEGRTALIAAQVARLGLDNVRPITRDATVLKEDLVQSMDAVLLDAPCSGLGNMADKPDVKYRPTPESLAQLVQLQHDLLETCSAYVKRGGTLVYTTCSILKDENERQIRRFLENHPEFTLDKLPETIPERFRDRADVGMQLLPHRDGVTGFYIARMKRSRV